ncbi:hypothetical protein [Streptomyces sp. NPDC007088]|uniref:hypothetical protein n=1 Tax=Streptomyces sp. NPDC007088 TaxID=3364773 RepID=UPI0036CE3FF5
MFPVDAVDISKKNNLAVISRIGKRAEDAEGVLGPCLRAYCDQVSQAANPQELLSNLTAPLLAAFDETRLGIERRMREKWRHDPERVQSSVTNSLRRSAGTNYQALVTYALAKYLHTVGSAWYVQHPVPKGLQQSLAIVFGAGVDDADVIEDVADGEEGSDVAPSEYVVAPDVDVLLRNAAWVEGESGEPVILLSVKTSLADRAGMAARWKTYFDQATQPCPHSREPGCAYTRLGISMPNAGRFAITHGIVTANIYKINFHDSRYRVGELSSGQTRSNTYMFDLRLTTRDDGIAFTPSDWAQFPTIVEELKIHSQRHGLPQ